jgi:hypothetical protein
VKQRKTERKINRETEAEKDRRKLKNNKTCLGRFQDCGRG